MRISDWSSDVCSSDLGLSESKLPKPAWRSVQPLGASGLTYSKCWKLAGYLGFSSYSVRAWRGAASARVAQQNRQSEERSVGKACVSTGRCRRARVHYKNTQMKMRLICVSLKIQ